MPGPVSRMVAVAFALLAGACTTVRIQVADRGDVEVRQMFGVAAVDVKPGSGVVYEMVGVGASSGSDGFVLGYHSATVVNLPPDRCQLIVWINSNEQLEKLADLVRERKDVCTVQPATFGGGKK